mgnify:CR=1 FL=1
MSKIVEIYENYLKAYKSYQKKKEQIQAVDEEIKLNQKELETARLNVNELKQRQKEAESEFNKSKDTLNEFTLKYERDSKPRSIEHAVEEFDKNQIYYKGELTQGTVYIDTKEKINKLYSQKKSEYYKKRKAELEYNQVQIKNELEKLHSNKEIYIQEKKEKIYKGCDEIIKNKIGEIKEYLSYSSYIKKSESAIKINNVIENKRLNPEDCGKSEEKLLKSVLELEGTSKYPRNEIVTKESVKLNKEMYNNRAKPFVIIIGIIMALVFAFVFSPVNMLIPSGGDIAGAGQVVTQTIVRVGFSLLIGASAGGLLFGILRLFGMKVGSIILGIIAGIYGIVVTYNESYPIIEESSFYGFGNGVHFIIVWFLQIILIILVTAIVYCLINNTSLVKLFYKPKESIVIAGLKRYEEYFSANQEKFIALFHINEAMEYACENHLKENIAQNQYQIEYIYRDEVYLSFEKEHQKELNKLEESYRKEQEKEKQSQRENIEKRKRKYEELKKEDSLRIQYLKEHLENLKQDYEIKSNENSILKQKVTNSEVQEKKVKEVLMKKQQKKEEIIGNERKEKEFIEDVIKNICLSHEDLKHSFEKINNPMALLECKGILERNLYFVRNKKDESDMAVIRKIPLECKPTIFVYKKECIKGNNLSEELSHFIEWLCDSVRRVIPAEILSRFSVVDMVSGQSILYISPFNEYLDVISDEVDKNKFAEYLKNREIEITEQCNRRDIGDSKQVINSIASLNQVKMEINKEDILKQKNIAISDFWEQLVQYKVVIFVVSPIVGNSVQPSILNDILKQSVKNSERFGILPIFLVDDENWKDEKTNSDISFLHGIKDKNVWKVINVGKELRMELDLEL